MKKRKTMKRKVPKLSSLFPISMRKFLACQFEWIFSTQRIVGRRKFLVVDGWRYIQWIMFCVFWLHFWDSREVVVTKNVYPPFNHNIVPFLRIFGSSMLCHDNFCRSIAQWEHRLSLSFDWNHCVSLKFIPLRLSIWRRGYAYFQNELIQFTRLANIRYICS